MWEAWWFFMFIIAVLSTTLVVVGLAGLVEILGIEGLEGEGVVKWMVRIAGPAWFFEREIVMGIVGLWYLRRGRH